MWIWSAFVFGLLGSARSPSVGTSLPSYPDELRGAEKAQPSVLRLLIPGVDVTCIDRHQSCPGKRAMGATILLVTHLVPMEYLPPEKACDSFESGLAQK